MNLKLFIETGDSRQHLNRIQVDAIKRMHVAHEASEQDNHFAANCVHEAVCDRDAEPRDRDALHP